VNCDAPFQPGLAAALLVGAYLLGSVSFSYWIVRLVKGADVRAVGSGNAGATNVMRAAGKGPAIAALILDILKGVAAVVVARAAGAPPPVVGGAAVAVVLGHVFPVFLGFRGGKGVATSAGAMAALDPLALGLAVVVFAAVVGWKRYVSLGSMAAAAAFPVFVLLFGRRCEGDVSLVVAAGLIAALVLYKHRGNWRRLRTGVEPRLGERRGAAVSASSEGGPGEGAGA
jgi:acyl phosphate:glycerol-3-phosphate acyltransferase